MSDIFFFSLLGDGGRGVQGAAGKEGARGREGICSELGNFGGRGLKYFFFGAETSTKNCKVGTMFQGALDGGVSNGGPKDPTVLKILRR